MKLVISTATAACSVSLIDGDTLIAEYHDVVGRGHAERLIPMISALPRKGRADAILVDCGPGSFTGVRVGLAAARALALAWSIPVQGLSTMALLAAGSKQDCECLGIAVAGGHGELFVQSFALHPIVSETDLASLSPTEAAGFITATHVSGSGAAALVTARGYGEAVDALPRAADARWLPSVLCALPPSPIYGRAPDAVPA